MAHLEPIDLSASLDVTVATFTGTHGRPPRVLVAISDDLRRDVVVDRLRAHGCSVVPVATAAILHDIVLQEQDLDIVVVDESLSGTSPLHGIGFARQRGLRAPVIFLCDAVADHLRTEVRRLGLWPCSRRAVAPFDRALLRAIASLDRPSLAA